MLLLWLHCISSSDQRADETDEAIRNMRPVCLSVRAAESGWILWRDLDSFSSHLILSHLHQAAEILLCFSFITEVDSHETASLTYENHFFYHSWLHLSVSSFIHWLIFSPFVWLFSHCFLMSVCQVYGCPSLPSLTSDLWPNQLLPHLSSLFINVYSSSNLHQFTPRYCSCMHSSSAASGWQQMNSGRMRRLSLNTVTTALWLIWLIHNVETSIGGKASYSFIRFIFWAF